LATELAQQPPLVIRAQAKKQLVAPALAHTPSDPALSTQHARALPESRTLLDEGLQRGAGRAIADGGGTVISPDFSQTQGGLGSASVGPTPEKERIGRSDGKYGPKAVVHAVMLANTSKKFGNDPKSLQIRSPVPSMPSIVSPIIPALHSPQSTLGNFWVQPAPSMQSSMKHQSLIKPTQSLHNTGLAKSPPAMPYSIQRVQDPVADSPPPFPYLPVEWSAERIESVRHTSATITLKLGIDFQSTAGKIGSQLRAVFEQDLQHDLARASGWTEESLHGIPPENFHIKMVAPGSVIVDTEIQADPTGAGPDPWLVAENIQEQESDPNSLLRSGILTKHTTAVTVNNRLDRPVAGKLKLTPKKFEPHTDLNNSRGSHLVDPHPVHCTSLDIPRSIRKGNFALPRSQRGIMSPDLRGKYVADIEEDSIKVGTTTQTPSPPTTAPDPLAISRSQYIEVAPDLATTVMGDWALGTDSEGSFTSPTSRDGSRTITRDLGSPKPPTPPRAPHTPRPPTHPRGRLSLVDTPRELPHSASPHSENENKLSRSRSRSEERHQEFSAPASKPKLHSGPVLMSAEMVYYDENKGVIAAPRGKKDKIILKVNDNLKSTQPYLTTSSNPSSFGNRNLVPSYEATANPDPVTVMADWYSVMGDFVPEDLDLSGLSGGEPPLRPLPQLPNPDENINLGDGPPNKPLPKVNADITSSGTLRATDGGAVGAVDEDLHRLMTYRINSEAAATMRGINTLLAVLQARNDAAEAKIRGQDNLISERGIHVQTLACCIRRAHVHACVHFLKLLFTIVCVCMRIRVCVCVCACVCLPACVCVCVHVRMRVRVHVCVCVCLYLCLCVCVFVQIRA